MKTRPVLLRVFGIVSVVLALPKDAIIVKTCSPKYLPGDHSIMPRSLSITREGRAGVGPWPKGELRVYFPDSDSRELLDTMEDAMKVWRSGSPQLSHLRIVVDDTESRNTMRTTLTDNGRQSTSIGYDRNGGMSMDFDPKASVGTKNAVINMVHELGHALGLYHEHQRPDAMKYVNFDCKALKDYDSVKKVAKKKREYTMEQLCENDIAAERYNFSASNFIPFDKQTTKDWEGEFDFDSIMMYGSYFGGEKPGFFSKGARVLTRAEPKGAEIIPSTRPSKGDYDRMIKLYG